VKVRIADIPQEGLELEFKLGLDAINNRLAQGVENGNKKAVHVDSNFEIEPEAKIKLTIEGSTIFFNGEAMGVLTTDCSRCLEKTKAKVVAKINLVLKPVRERESELDKLEDLNFGSYEGKEIDCAVIAEEYLTLALPQVVVCSKDCKGLCPKCGENLNVMKCNCKTENEFVDERFSVLKDLKIH
jgi:uncharacterized protein